MKSRQKRKNKTAVKVTVSNGKRRNPRGQKGVAATPIAEARRKRPRLHRAGTRNGLATSPRVAAVTRPASTTITGPRPDGVADTASKSASAMPVRRWRSLAELQLSMDRAAPATRLPQDSCQPSTHLQSQQAQMRGMTPAELRRRLVKAADHMSIALSISTGLKDFSQKLVIYWTLATHSLPHAQLFPLLCLSGKMGTGKSETLRIISKFAFHPHRFSLRGATLPVIRDELAKCAGGTAIVEEADQAWKDDSVFERMLSDRYQTASAEAAHKIKVGDYDWETVNKKYFGATVLHRRIPFCDPALSGRTVFVRFRPDHGRQYGECRDEDKWIVEGAELMHDFTMELPVVEQPPGVAARVFNTYQPLISVGHLCADRAFLCEIQNRLDQETAELKEAQSAEPDGLVLRAIVEAVFSGPGQPNFRNIKFSELTESIWKNQKFSLSPRQVGPMARELGFMTKPSHGVTVVVPTPATLLRACDECEYRDEAIAELRRQVLGV